MIPWMFCWFIFQQVCKTRYYILYPLHKGRTLLQLKSNWLKKCFSLTHFPRHFSSYHNKYQAKLGEPHAFKDRVHLGIEQMGEGGGSNHFLGNAQIYTVFCNVGLPYDVLHFRTFPGTLHLFKKSAWQKMSFTLALSQASFHNNWTIAWQKKVLHLLTFSGTLQLFIKSAWQKMCYLLPHFSRHFLCC